jgi:DNA-directed RNA polymerase specialized sigma24 family protein
MHGGSSAAPRHASAERLRTGRVAKSRDEFWHTLMKEFSPRLRAYLRRACASRDEAEEILWDVWADATDHEEALMSPGDHWPIFHALLTHTCARHKIMSRHEAPLVENDAVASSKTTESVATDVRWEWTLQAMVCLSEKQRLAVTFRHY